MNWKFHCYPQNFIGRKGSIRNINPFTQRKSLKINTFFQNCKSTHRINSALVQEMVCSRQAPNHFCNYAEYLHLDFFYRELCSDSRLKILLLKSQHWSQKWSDAAMSQAFFAGTKNMQHALGLQTNFSQERFALVQQIHRTDNKASLLVRMSDKKLLS